MRTVPRGRGHGLSYGSCATLASSGQTGEAGSLRYREAEVGLFDFIKAITGSKSGTGRAAQAGTFVERRLRPRRNARGGTRVLIIDDSPTIAVTLHRMLGSVGFVPLHAPDAERGLELARQELPELIFLDIILPGMNGFAALRALRRDPRTRHIPVIMMSGNEKAMEQFYGARIGADDFMMKPFSRQEVFSRIENLLDEDLLPRRRPPAGAEAVPTA